MHTLSLRARALLIAAFLALAFVLGFATRSAMRIEPAPRTVSAAPSPHLLVPFLLVPLVHALGSP